MRLNSASRAVSQFCDSGTSPWLLAFTLFAHLGSSIQLVTTDALPSDISEGCQSALLSDVSECSLTATKFRYGYFYPESTLSDACTTDCASALVSFEKSVISACSNDTWDGYDDEGMPVAYIPGAMRFLYDLTCLQDGGRFCNVVAGTNAAMADPGDGESGWLSSVANSTDAADECDLCFVKSLRLQAGSPYYNGPVISESSLYESKTSSCSIKDMPLTTTALATTIPEPSPTSTPCAGKMYDIQPGDDCHSISTSQGISTGWLLSDNNLASFCSDFPTSGSLCLENTCSVYTVQTNDTCKDIAKSNNITEALLVSWNPSISSGCGNIGRLVGQEVCVSVPGTPYKDPASTILAPTVASTPAPVPTDIAPGVNQNCGRYYQVQPDEYCNLIVLHFGISLPDFQFLNPDINENCTNLFAYESYCILPVGDINTYPGRPGATTAPPTTTLPFTSIVSLDAVATTAPIVTSTALPLAADSREDCARFFDGRQMLEEDISTTSYKNACEFAAAVWAISVDDLVQWNPDLGNVTNGECNMVSDVRYCGKLLYADPPEAQVGPDYEFDVRAGAIETCTQFADAYPDWDCNDILLNYELTIAQFYAYNPEVGTDCGNLWTSYAYCIRDPDYTSPDTPSSTTAPPSSTTASAGPPGPTHSGQPANCNKWHVVVDGDSCPSVEKEYGITAAQFFAWNPAVSTDCTTNFWLGSAYCVGVSSSSATTTTTTPTPTSTGPSVPTPTQAGNAVDDCNAYAQAQDGDYCAAFAERNGISDVDLYAWNKVLGSGGENCGSSLWAGYWYCIGVMSENRLLELVIDDTA